jgi:hypothetical protein
MFSWMERNSQSAVAAGGKAPLALVGFLEAVEGRAGLDENGRRQLIEAARFRQLLEPNQATMPPRGS